MSTFQVSKHKQNKTNRNLKAVAGWTILGVSTLIFLFSATRLLPFLQQFFLGILGVFIYPLTVLGVIIALALLNNKRYVMPKKYAIFLALSLIVFLMIIQLILIGSPKGRSFGEYLALNYTKKFTAGGIIIGFLPTCMAKLMGLPATYILLSIIFAVCVAFFVEAIISLRKTEQSEKPIKLQIKEKKVEKPIHISALAENPKISQKREEVNVMYGGNQEQEEKRELTAREKLGLVGGYKQQVGQPYRPEEVVLPQDKKEKETVPQGMSMREYLLSPPKLDLDKFRERQDRITKINFANSNFQQRNTEIRDSAPNVQPINTSSEEIQSNISQLKEEPIQAQSSNDYQPTWQVNLPDIKPEEITNEAENIVRSVFMQEKIERKEDSKREDEEQSNKTFSDLRREGGFNREENLEIDKREERSTFERNDFTRRDNFTRDNLDRNNFSREDRFNNEDKNEDDFIESRDMGEDIFKSSARELNRENAFNRDNAEQPKKERSLAEFVKDEFVEGKQNEVVEDKEFINFDDIEEKPEEKEEVKPQRNNLLTSRDRERGEFLKPLNIDRFDSQEEKPMDEMEKRKRFVSLDEDNKKEETFKPYKYKRPSLDLLTTVSDDPATFNSDMPLKRVALENVLENFGVPAKVQNVVVGPTVTRYEIEMPEGISVKKILSMDADIAYALSANGEIRIEAPIPGRSMVGIEVPNSRIAKVSVKDILSSKEFASSSSALTFALGKDITGNVKVCNLQKMPHLLVAGTTGSGKSVCLNTIIVSLLYKSSPDEVKFIMIDPKQVELSMYEGLPHMVVPKVITDPTKAVNALQWAVDEMERRFNLISEERVRNIDEYNQIDRVLQHKVRKMPYIVIIFDEFADFMAVAKNEIEDKIKRLAGKARAAGIHLILATQRPSTDVVTGTLKANLPARIAFKVASSVDSGVIMGSPGAEKLLGHGDMLYKPADAAPARLQGCLIETQETKDVVNYIIENNEEIFDEAFNAINNPNKANTKEGGENNGVDPLLPQALKICIDNGVASTTMVQRKLSIGYPRAARIVDQMEERGYISSAEGSKQRSVYISIEEFYSIFGDIYD